MVLLVTVDGLAVVEINFIWKFFCSHKADVSTLNEHILPEREASISHGIGKPESSTILH